MSESEQGVTFVLVHLLICVMFLQEGELISSSLASDVPLVTEEVEEKALKGMKRGKLAVYDGKTVVLLKEGGDILL